MARPRTRICKRGHDTFICGRDKSNGCVLCKSILNKEFQNKHCTYNSNYYLKHKQELDSRNRDYYLAHKKEMLDSNKKYRANHPEIVNAFQIKHQTNRRLRIVAWTDWGKIKKVYKNCSKNMTVDHIIPLQGKLVSGLHVSWNLQYLAPSKNFSKNRHTNLHEISSTYGRLLMEEKLK